MTNEHVCRYLELCPDGSYFCGGCQKTYRLTLEPLREQEAKAIQALEHIRDYCNGTEANGIARSALVDIAEMNAHEPGVLRPMIDVRTYEGNDVLVDCVELTKYVTARVVAHSTYRKNPRTDEPFPPETLRLAKEASERVAGPIPGNPLNDWKLGEERPAQDASRDASSGDIDWDDRCATCGVKRSFHEPGETGSCHNWHSSRTFEQLQDKP